MKFLGSEIRTEEINFMIISVKLDVFKNKERADAIVKILKNIFSSDILLMTTTTKGANFYGKPIYCKFMIKVPISSLKWKPYTI